MANEKGLIETIKDANTLFFYITNLSREAWRDPKNLQAVCERIMDYGKQGKDSTQMVLDKVKQLEEVRKFRYWSERVLLGRMVDFIRDFNMGIPMCSEVLLFGYHLLGTHNHDSDVIRVCASRFVVQSIGLIAEAALQGLTVSGFALWHF